jgi:hypothetical protein
MRNELETLDEQIKILRANIRSGLVRAYEANGGGFDGRMVSIEGPKHRYLTYDLNKLHLKVLMIKREILLFKQDEVKFAAHIKRLNKVLSKTWNELLKHSGG